MAIRCPRGKVVRKAYTYRRNGKLIKVKAACVSKPGTKKRKATATRKRKVSAAKKRKTTATRKRPKKTYTRNTHYCPRSGGRYKLHDSPSGAIYYIKNGKKIYPGSTALLYGLC